MSDPWWHSAVTYEVYVRSFSDSDGDGVGDLPGIRSRLPYLAELGVDAVWLTPFYRSPMADHGYDVADYRDVDPVFGTLADLDALLEEAHSLGLRVIVDVVPNHTSSEHAWFQEALADPSSPARRRYHFRDPGPDGGPPNNWTSVFGGPAWTLDPASGQYYLHLFAPEQPDLDWANPEVHDEMESVLRFWLDRGVDGFRIDVAHGLYKHPDYAPVVERDEPDAAPAGEFARAMASEHLWDREEVHEVYRRWRRVLDEYPGDRVLVGEVYLFDVARVVRYVRPDELHLAFNFTLMQQPLDADVWRGLVREALEQHAAAGAAACTWVLSSHDVTRPVTRYGGGDVGRARWRAALLVLLALPGAPYLYQGEELGLEEADVPPDRRQDPIWERSGGTDPGRDGCRTPIPWTREEPGLGFTSGEPWLPFGAGAPGRSVQAQQGDDASTLAFVRRALRLRGELLAGAYAEVEGPPGTLAFRRGELLCALSTSDAEVRLPCAAAVSLVLASDAGVRVDGAELVLPPGAAAWVRG